MQVLNVILCHMQPIGRLRNNTEYNGHYADGMVAHFVINRDSILL